MVCDADHNKMLVNRKGMRFEINQLSFADVTALVADSEGKLCVLVSEFGVEYAKDKSCE